MAAVGGERDAHSQVSDTSRPVELFKVPLLLDGGPFIPTLLFGTGSVSGCPGVSNSTCPHGMECFQNALDGLSHWQQVSQTASLPAERVVNGTVLPVGGGHSCRAPSRTLLLAQLTWRNNVMLLAIKWPYGAGSQEKQLFFNQ